MNNEILIKAESVSKKFCRNLKRSLFYGVQSITNEMFLLTKEKEECEKLRPGEFWALRDINLEIRRGECMGLIGRNGAGKSTLLKLLNGLIKPDHGRITIKGRVRALIELGAGFNPILTGLENIYINAAVLGIPKSEIDKKLDEIIDFAEIGDFIETPVKNYSSGMKVRLGFAIAVQMEPDVLIIDEVLAVGDVGFRAKCFNTIAKLSPTTAVIFVSHHLPQVARVSTNLLVLNHGKTAFFGADIPKGFGIYHSLFKEENCVITGSGEAELLDLEFDSNGKQGVQSINYGDNLTIRMKLIIDNSIRNPVVYVTFLNQSLQSEININSNIDNCVISNREGIINLKLIIREINLNPGIHFVSIGVHKSKPFTILKQYYAYKKLVVMGDFLSIAPVQLKGEWIAD